MNDEIYRKQRSKHNRKRKKVVLVVLRNKGTTISEIANLLNLNENDVVIRVIYSGLNGKDLRTAVKRYMKAKQISVSKGDQVLFWQK